MELAAATVGIVELTAKASSAIWKLCAQWKNAPLELSQLRDDIDRASMLYALVQRCALTAIGSSGDPVHGATAHELAALLSSGSDTVGKLQEIVYSLLRQSSEKDEMQGDGANPQQDVPSRVWKLTWIRKTASIRFLRRSLRHNLEQVGLHLTLLNLYDRNCALVNMLQNRALTPTPDP